MGLHDLTRFRQSCDKCQSSKVRCSREPVCRRCAQRQFKCIYSPVRRIGRPRKIQATNTDDDAASRIHEVDGDGQEGSQASTAATTPYELEFRHPASHDLSASQMRRPGHIPTTIREAAAQSFPLSPMGSDSLLFSVIDTYIPDHDPSPIASGGGHTPADTRKHEIPPRRCL